MYDDDMDMREKILQAVRVGDGVSGAAMARGSLGFHARQ